MRRHRPNIEHSRELRREQTDSETRLWTFLRTRPLGFKFRRQHQIGPWIADLACPEAHLVIELDGGGHADLIKEQLDLERTESLREHGWQVLRFWNTEVIFEFEGVLEVLFQHLRSVRPSLWPSPRSRGEGEP